MTTIPSPDAKKHRAIRLDKMELQQLEAGDLFVPCHAATPADILLTFGREGGMLVSMVTGARHPDHINPAMPVYRVRIALMEKTPATPREVPNG